MGMMFVLLLTSAVAIAGISGYVIFGPLTFAQLTDRGRRIGAHAFSPVFLKWILRGEYRGDRDPGISGLATPARILLWCFIAGVVATLVLLPFKPL